jgi:hypothetical protein
VSFIGDTPRYTDVREIVHKARRDSPSPVSLASKMQHEPDKAAVVDLGVHRVLAEARAAIAEAEHDHEGQQRVQECRDQVKVADIAVMLSGILDDGQVFRLRNTAPDATLAELAVALESI